jgi:rhodanese-related sulfurtransferase
MTAFRARLRLWRVPRVLGWSAAVLATGALLADLGGSPVSLGAALRAVAQGQDAVGALELAQWIREDRPGLRVIDVRDPVTFEEYGLLDAENVALANLAETRFRASDTIVVYSDGDTPAAQAVALLRTRGYRNAYYLRGGLTAWAHEVMQPELRADATPQEKEAFRAISELSRWFGGVPRTGVAGAPPLSPATTRLPARPAQPLRRGCGGAKPLRDQPYF